MATSGNGRKSGSSSAKKKTNTRGRSTGKKTTSRASSSKKSTQKQSAYDGFEYTTELILVGVALLIIFFFLCIIGVISSSVDGKNNLGDLIRLFFTGVFGISAYYLPIAAIVIMALWYFIKEKDKGFYIRLGAVAILMLCFGIFAHLIAYNKGDLETYVGNSAWAGDFYGNHTGGGFIFGAIALLLVSLIGRLGSVFVGIILTIVGIGVFVLPYIPTILEYTRREPEVGDDYYDDDEDEEEYEEPVRQRRPQTVTRRKTETSVDHDLTKLQKKKEEREIRQKREPEERESAGLHLMNDRVASRKAEPDVKNTKPAGGISLPEKPETKNIHRVEMPDTDENDGGTEDWIRPVTTVAATPRRVTEEMPVVPEAPEPVVPKREAHLTEMASNYVQKNKVMEGQQLLDGFKSTTGEIPAAQASAQTQNQTHTVQPGTDGKKGRSPSMYKLPPVSLLKPSEKRGKTDDRKSLEETARRLEETLETFGVRVRVTDYSKGPSVTRYELQPEMGVKVSRIVSLADDIKLNLAAADIRIEAPIPGKQAVGIEVPNQVASAVSFRDLIETSQFKDFKSNIAFAVGKDIAGDVIVADLAKMPHVLIAGATGSGKSVCINTLIMSILYKANPEDVKLILVDPKVVELSVYNGIPHLLLPVVTDPKQASGALQWGVAEMTERYRKFADQGVRDLKGYNEKAMNQPANTPEEERITKMPQIVIIVDELADLMMVASKEVEESICRLAQLARAAGIHLVIATQRPSVDVITGLIKANMPSRIAFSVSSGIDSRTILDSNGAEKLLGKGDMLYYPQGLTKPSRVQGAFISDEEVQNVVDFIKNQNICSSYQSDIPTVITNGISGGTAAPTAPGDDRDEYFAEAGRFVIEKQKGSIGMLQRIFKIGFNRAARIMDQLEEAGVVGPEEGTKPRRILMNIQEFEEYLDSE